MKFLLDMGISKSTAEFLRSAGFDAVHLREQGLQRLQDEAIIQKARQETRIILTHDLDFGRLIALSQAPLPSVITFRLSNMAPASVNQYLVQTLERFGSELENGALISINEQAVRARKLPIL